MDYNGLMFAVRSVIGTREEQQDAIGTYSENGVFAAVVCDGMGGLKGGALASKSAIEIFLSQISDKEDSENIADLFLRSIDIMDEKVFSFIDEEGQKLNAGTTVVSVYIKDGLLSWMSVGDSRLYIIRGNEIMQATRDHNYFLTLNSMPPSFQPGPEDLEKGEALISFIGMGGISIMDISTNPFKLFDGDYMLLTSDGLTKTLSDEQILQIIQQKKDIEEAADALLKASEEAVPESRDNTSFILIKK